MDSNATQVIWRRLMYMLTPQLDIYKSIRKVVKDKDVLEFGFGTGIGVLQYCDVARKVRAVEVDYAAVKFAKTMFPINSVEWDWGDIIHSQYRNYDVVIAVEVIEHVASIRMALFAIANSLKKNGFAIITTPNRYRYRAREEDLVNKEFTPVQFISMLERYFNTVYLLDSKLNPTDAMLTSETPIIAVAGHAR